MALVTIRRSSSVQTPRKSDEAEKSNDNIEDDLGNRVSKSLNECYFANKGAALVLGGAERGCADQARSPARAPPQPDIQHHLQAMFSLLRPEETLKMAVKLESAHAGRTRYLVVVCHGEEAALLGIDCNERTTVGLVLRVLADTSIKLDGDGGFSVCVCHQQHIFKPVSVQAMWSALQTLHRASGRAREFNHFAGGASHAWCIYYDGHVDSDRSCLNEWHAMDCIESRRPPSPDSLRHKPRERDETERVIRCTLKEIMMSVDLDEVTSKAIRGRLEDDLDMDLAEYKSFIDHEMLTILGQMDAPTEVFDHVYLGSEWNASNLEELQRNGVRHILNVTREIDNFFPGVFDYLNIRVYDDEKTDLLKHWDNTFKYINKARNEGSKVLVHCKMGISRSASVVIAYAMKAFNWNFDRALKHVKTKRNCIKPNTNFLNQLETYQGILDAMKNKEKLQRSKSETNLKSPKSQSKSESKALEPTPLVLALTGSRRGRARSWAAGARLAAALPPTSVSLERLPQTRHMLMPCANGSYSVSPNQIIRLKEEGPLSVKHIVSEIESAASAERRELRRYHRLNFGIPNDTLSNKSDASGSSVTLLPDVANKLSQTSPSKNTNQKYTHANLEVNRIHTWDPGEGICPRSEDNRDASDSDNLVKSDSGINVKLKTSDAFLNLESNLEESEFRRAKEDAATTSEQSAQSSVEGDDAARGGSWRDKEDLAAIAEHEPRRAHNERKFNETCAILRQAGGAGRARARGASTWGGTGSASGARPALRRRRASQPELPRAAPPAAPAGHVRWLRQEFEARAEPPVSVRQLVGRYDAPAERRDPSKKSKLEGRRAPERPPPAPLAHPVDYPSVLVSTVMSKAQNKKQLQHGKTHPLTRLNLNRSNNRCSNPVYNTM